MLLAVLLLLFAATILLQLLLLLLHCCSVFYIFFLKVVRNDMSLCIMIRVRCFSLKLFVNPWKPWPRQASESTHCRTYLDELSTT